MKKGQDYDKSLLKLNAHKQRINQWLVIGLVIIILIARHLSSPASDTPESSTTIVENMITIDETKTQTTQFITTETTVSSISETLTRQEVTQLFNRTLGAIKGEHSLFYQEILARDTQTHQSLVINNRPIRAASTIKLFILLALYEKVELGEIDLEDKHTLSADEKVGGTGSLQSKPNGSEWTYRQLANLMIVESDNTASNIIIDTLGGVEVVQTMIKKLGYSQTELNRKFLDIDALNQGIDNYVTAYEIGDLLNKMYRGELISKTASQEMLAYLSEQQYRDKLRFSSVCEYPNFLIIV